MTKISEITFRSVFKPLWILNQRHYFTPTLLEKLHLLTLIITLLPSCQIICHQDQRKSLPTMNDTWQYFFTASLYNKQNGWLKHWWYLSNIWLSTSRTKWTLVSYDAWSCLSAISLTSFRDREGMNFLW